MGVRVRNLVQYKLIKVFEYGSLNGSVLCAEGVREAGIIVTGKESVPRGNILFWCEWTGTAAAAIDDGQRAKYNIFALISSLGVEIDVRSTSFLPSQLPSSAKSAQNADNQCGDV